MADVVIDCLGEFCPMPVIKLRTATPPNAVMNRIAALVNTSLQ